MNSLPKIIKRTVYNAVFQFGLILQSDLGKTQYARIENIRKKMRLTRSASLQEEFKKLKKLSSKEQFEIAHAFSFMLELINTCENAYRTYRLKSEEISEQLGGRDPIIHVLTAHPTEARSSLLISCFQIIQSHLVHSFEKSESIRTPYFRSLILRAWKVSMTLNQKPSVQDEADHLFSIVLQKDILETFLKFQEEGPPVYLRSWVGGDKDGHPGVDEKTFIQSLECSRKKLIHYLLDLISTDQAIIDAFGFQVVFNELKSLKQIKKGDARRLASLKEKLLSLPLKADVLNRIQSLFRLFPGIVIPLELRESADLIKDSLKQKQKTAIARMLNTLSEISSPFDPNLYARGLIVSMTENSQDLINALKLVKREMNSTRLPVIPLLEKESSLVSAVSIIEGVLKDSNTKKALANDWMNKYEIMLGYSDSSKESGALASRVMILKAVNQIDRFFKKKKAKPVFFHGSGGSVARGGGSITEQTQWWPKSALEPFKTTVQGEMVQRNFSSPEIFMSQTMKVVQKRKSIKKHYGSFLEATVSDEFVKKAKDIYQQTVRSDSFLKLIEHVTPYQYLSELKIGSRPSKRRQGVQLEHLRAIPWVLCWTQTRVLFPVWWGLGSSWSSLDPKRKKSLSQYYRRHPLYSSFVMQLAFTLSKVELPIWNFYIDQSSLSEIEKKYFKNEFKKEFNAALEFVRAVSNKKELVWFRPWLQESIYLRSPMIHPLNLLQLIAIEKKDMTLLRQTVTGIACGMLTTG